MDTFLMKENCDRCSEKLTIRTMSRFNTDCICPKCEEKEKKHPKYQEAVKAELEAVRNGNYNFEGIGKPSDL